LTYTPRLYFFSRVIDSPARQMDVRSRQNASSWSGS
jgi:hypothetical protein